MSDYVPGGTFPASRTGHFVCACCDRTVFDISQSVRWLDIGCCSLKCFRAYFERSFLACDTCQTSFTDRDIHFVHSTSGMLAFCDPKCKERYLNESCQFCFVSVSKKRHAELRSVTNRIYCSLLCLRAHVRTFGAEYENGQCFACERKASMMYQIKSDKENMWSICSDNCLQKFESNTKMVLDTCSLCHIKYDGTSFDAAQLTEFSGEKRIFCTNACLSYQLTKGSKKCACNECDGLFQYYEMFRTLSPDGAEKTWCSLDCAERQISVLAATRVSGAHIELVSRELRGIYQRRTAPRHITKLSLFHTSFVFRLNRSHPGCRGFDIRF